MPGTLVLVATPIGNLGDASPRMAEALAAANVIACEDTRRLAKLLSHLGVSRAGKKVVVYADYNEEQASRRLAADLKAGATVALVSDGGVPLIADPGYVILQKGLTAGAAVELIPGPSAVQTALALSGLAPHPYIFLGYTPRRQAERRAFLAKYADTPATAVFFITPHRVATEIADILAVWGNRDAALARELTKIFQEVVRAPLKELAETVRKRRLKGEMTLVVAAPPEGSANGLGAAYKLAIALTEENIPPARAAAVAARTFNVPRRAIYNGLRRRQGTK